MFGYLARSSREKRPVMYLATEAEQLTVEITAPAQATLAPPGFYMLFLVDGNGVPSVGSIVQLG